MRVRFRSLDIGSGLHVGCVDAGPLRLRRGEEEAPPLVLLHGIGADRGEWSLTLPLLARRRRVIALDLLGHGLTSKPSGAGVNYRLRLLADVAVQGLEALPEGAELQLPVDLLGHSLGGAVALDIVRRYARLVRRLVLVDSAGLAPAQSLGPLAISLPFAPRNFGESRRLLATSVNNKFLNNALVALAANAYKGKRKNRHELLKLLAAIACGDDVVTLRDLSRIRHETLLLWGDGDRVFPVATGRRLEAALPNARLEILPRCGHVPPTERPIAFARRVEAFLSGP